MARSKRDTLKPCKYLRCQFALEALESRLVLDSTVVFNEIMYNPSGTDETLEWIELHNQMSIDLDISGWSLREAVRFEFPDGTVVPGGGHLVIAGNLSALQNAVDGINVLGPFTGRLSNGGERIELLNNSNRLMSAVEYADDGDWPIGPDGSGASMAKFAPLSASELSQNWRSSTEVGGTPGRDNFLAGEDNLPNGLSDLVINEIAAAGSEDDFFVELRNISHDRTPRLVNPSPVFGGRVDRAGVDVALDGLVLVRSGDGANEEFVLPAQTVGPGETVSWDAAILGFTGAQGTRIFLYSPEKDSLIDAQVVSDRLQGRSSQQDGRWSYPNAPTPGAENRFSLNNDIVINEIQYHAAPQLATETSRETRLPIKRFNSSDTWRFYQSTSGLDGLTPSWFHREFDDRMWASGTSPFGAELETPDYSALILAEAPLAYWRLNEFRGPTVFDATDRGHDGRADAGVQFGQSSLLRNDTVDTAIRTSFDDRIVIPGFQKFPDGSTGYTLEYWLTVNSLTSTEHNIVSDRESLLNSFVTSELTRGGNIRASFNVGSRRQITGTAVLGVGQTYHIVVTWDKVNELGNIYVDGTLDATREVRLGKPKNTDNPLFLGKANFGGGGDITLDEVAVYNRPFSADDVQRHFGAGLRTGLKVGPTTHYFRNEFAFDGDPSRSQLQIDLKADDGAVVYLNGIEVFRHNMPNGHIDHLTPASNPVETAEPTGLVTFDASSLVQGSNLLAVEVHQANPTGDDAALSVDLGITETTGEDVPFVESTEEWIELYNRGNAAIDLTGWYLQGAATFDFPLGQTIEPGHHLVIANDADTLRARNSDVADHIIGNFSGGLSNNHEDILLHDANGNLVDEVHYFSDKPWPEFADGGSSTLELKDPDADNSNADAWAASDESQNSQWHAYSYRGVAAIASESNYPVDFNELLLGLLGAGEILLDDIHVVEDADGSRIELVQNGDFERGTTDAWRFGGNHHGTVVDDAGNNVLHLVATGPTEHLKNQAETTLKNGEDFPQVQLGSEYEISFRAKWLTGSPQLKSRLYFNLLPRVTVLETPSDNGTPGRKNSTYEPNIGPTYDSLLHSPLTPLPDQPVTVSIVATDPDRVGEMTLWFSVDGGAWFSLPMTANAGRFQAQIPGQPSESIVQFYIQGRDNAGAESTFPAQGPDSRALVKVGERPTSTTGLHNLQIILTKADSQALVETVSLISNKPMEATVIYEGHVYYNVDVRLKGSAFGRQAPSRRGFSVRFHADDLFRGIHKSIGIDRSGGWRFGRDFGQDEILVHQFFNRAGNIPSMINDLVFVDAPNISPNTAILQMSRFGDNFIDSQYENGSEGTVYEYEIVFPMKASGNVEGPKFGFSGGPIYGVPVGRNLNDKEDYRYYFQIENNRRRDNYNGVIALANTFSLSGNAFHEAAGRVIDVDQWLRAFAGLTLSAAGDNYNTGGHHNALFYQRPGDGRMLLFPFDMDLTFIQDVTSPIVPAHNRDLVQLLTLPTNEHHFLGHLNDIIQQSYNAEYMSHWVNYYQSLLIDQDLSSIVNYIQERAEFVRNQFPPQVQFAVRSTDPLDVGDAAQATIQGTGWIDVREIQIAGNTRPLDIIWTSITDWQVSIPVTHDTHEVTLEAYDLQGHLIGTDTITIASMATSPVIEALRISEINYHPHDPMASELDEDATLGDNDFEFIELTNVSDQTIDLMKTQLVQVAVDAHSEGVTFDFSDGTITQLVPGERVLVVEDIGAFTRRYGNGLPIAGQWAGGLGNNGETITLIVASATVQQFAYDDAWYPETDGAGATLEMVNPNAADLELWRQDSGWRSSTRRGGTPGTPASGDFNGDNMVNSLDIDLLAAQLGNPSANLSFDLTDDNTLDARDLDMLVIEILGTRRGDTNLDGVVGQMDFKVLAENFGSTASGWSAGDSDGDGDIDFRDFVQLSINFGYNQA